MSITMNRAFQVVAEFVDITGTVVQFKDGLILASLIAKASAGEPPASEAEPTAPGLLYPPDITLVDRAGAGKIINARTTLWNEVVDLLAMGNKIDAIKVIKANVECTLKAAKGSINRFSRTYNKYQTAALKEAEGDE